MIVFYFGVVLCLNQCSRVQNSGRAKTDHSDSHAGNEPGALRPAHRAHGRAGKGPDRKGPPAVTQDWPRPDGEHRRPVAARTGSGGLAMTPDVRNQKKTNMRLRFQQACEAWSTGDYELAAYRASRSEERRVGKGSSYGWAGQ